MNGGIVKVGEMIKDIKKIEINDFEASLKSKNMKSELPPSPRKPESSGSQIAPRKERAGWGGNKPPQNQILLMELPEDDAFKKFENRQGKVIDTRPTIIFDKPLPQSKSLIEESKNTREKSPIKRMVNKMFGKSPPKKKIGQSAVEHVEPLRQIAE